MARDACRLTNRDLWSITQAARFSEDGSGPHCADTPEDRRWQSYVSISFGAKAIIYGCYTLRIEKSGILDYNNKKEKR